MTTSLRLLPSQRAEDATRRLMFVYASYQGWRAADIASRPRFSRLAFGDRWDALSGPAVLAQFVSVAEHFSAGLLMDNASAAIDGTPPIVQAIWKRVRNNVDSTWKNQVGAWRSFFAVDFGTAQYYEDLEPFIEARNSVLHGLGGLTRQQRERRDEAVQLIQTGGMRVVGNSLQIPHDAVVRCRDVAHNFILWLDLEDQRKTASV